MKYFRNEQNIELLYGLSRKFRNAIGDTKLNGEFSRGSCLYTFPIECCDDSQYYTDFGGKPNYRQSRLIDAYKILKRYLNK